MQKFLRAAVLTASVTATTLAPTIDATAGQRMPHGHTSRDNGSARVAAGILGLAIGAFAAAVVVSDDDQVEETNPYRHPRPSLDRDVVFSGLLTGVPETEEAEPEYAQSFEPWSRSWYRYCEDRYRSFDPETGTYVGYDGVERFCLTD